MTPEITPEEAYWHACSNTPIDAPGEQIPDVVSSYWCPAESAYRFTFIDGIVVNFDENLLSRARRARRSAYFRLVLAEQYWAARLKAAQPIPIPAPGTTLVHRDGEWQPEDAPIVLQGLEGRKRA